MKTECISARFGAIGKGALVAATICAAAMPSFAANEPDTYPLYVESDGTQYVDTSLNPNANMTIEADIDIISGGDVVGCSNYESYPITVNNGCIAGRLLRSGYATTDIPVNSGRKFIVSSATLNGKLSISVDGVLKAQSGGTCSVSTTAKSMYVFAGKDGTKCSAKLYGLKIYINDELVRDFVPGLKNGVAGLYDRQNDVWYTPSGAPLRASTVGLGSNGEIINADLPSGALPMEPSAYVQTGLIANFDGIRNAGLGQAHDPTATTWVNLGSGGSANNATLTALSSNIPGGSSDGEWTDFGYYFKGKHYFDIGNTINLGKEATVQLETEWTTTIGDCSGVNWPLIFGGSSADSDQFGIWHDKGKLSSLNLKILNTKKSVTNWDGYSLNAIFDGANTRCSISKETAYSWQGSMPNNTISSANTKYVIGTSGLTDGYRGPRMFKGIIRSVRIYDRILATDELVWNRVIDEIRFRGAVTNGVVVVASSLAGAEGTEANGTYYVNGSHTFTAPASVTVGDATYELKGYTLERYDASTQTWTEEGTYSEASFAYTNFAASAGTRITWNWRSPNEPDVYLDYVASDGRQWVNLSSLTQTATMTFDADMEWKSDANDATFIGQSWHVRNLFMVKDGTIRCMWFMEDNYAPADTGVSPGDGQRHRFVVTSRQGQKLSVTVDGGTPVYSAKNSDRAISNPDNQSLYLFAQHQGDGSAVGKYSSVKLYGLKVYGADGGLALDLVPGLKNDVAGLYDKVEDKWYVSGSGTALIPGPVANPQNLPDVYLDYVKSTGAQWVSIGLTPTRTMTFDVDLDWISGNTAIGQNYYDLYPLKMESGSVCSAWWGSGWANTGVRQDTGRHRFVVTTVDSQKVSTRVDGGEAAQSGGTSSRSDVKPYDLYVFGSHVGSTANQSGDLSTMKLYGLKIYGANGALARDYVPGIKDGVVGLYDRVSDKFVSSGTATPLEAGPVIDRSKPDAFVEYVSSSGSQWVDTGVDGRSGVKAEADIDWVSGNSPLGVIGNNHCLLLQNMDGIAGQSLGSGEVKTGVALNGGRRLIVSEARAGSKMTITVDGTTTAQSPNNVSANGTTGMTIWMFAAHGTGGKWGEGTSKFYGLKLWRTCSDGVCRLQRHFIPCVKGGRAGLYDAVSGVIFYSHSGTDLTASPTTRTLSVWRNEADDASLDNAANWCGGLPDGTDAVVCAPWLQTVSTANDLAYANLTVHNGAAIDLCGHTLTLSGLTGANSGSFASGAAINLDLSGRTDLKTIAKSANPYIVTWDSQPSATFTLDATTGEHFTLKPDGTGIKIVMTLSLVQRAGGENVGFEVSADLLTSLENRGLSSAATPSDVNVFLNAIDPNGLRHWENLVTGMAANQPPLGTISAETSSGSALTISVKMASDTNVTDKVNLGYTVLRELRKGDGETWTRKDGPVSDGTAFDIGLLDSNGASLNAAGLYRVVTLLAYGSVTNEIPSTNAVGIVEVGSTATNTITAVPWKRLASVPDEADSLTVSNFVSHANLSAGDAVYMLDGRAYKMWRKRSDGTWEAATTVSGSGASISLTEAGAPDTATIPCGGAVWVQRADATKPYFLVGQYDESAFSVTVPGSGVALVANPFSTNVTLNAINWGKYTGVNKDVIRIPRNGSNVELLYDSTAQKWGYYTLTTEGPFITGETFVPYDEPIPAGTGFIYDRKGGEGFTLEWK